MNFLIIEDDFVTALVLQEMLSEFGKSEIVENGLDGIAKIEHNLENNTPYDAVFLDIMLPEKSGQQILEEIRLLDNKYEGKEVGMTKVIMSTALDDYENIKKAFNNLCEGYIIKPFDKAKIMKALIDIELIYNDIEN